jgi:hypothetical protein
MKQKCSVGSDINVFANSPVACELTVEWPYNEFSCRSRVSNLLSEMV